MKEVTKKIEVVKQPVNVKKVEVKEEVKKVEPKKQDKKQNVITSNST